MQRNPHHGGGGRHPRGGQIRGQSHHEDILYGSAALAEVSRICRESIDRHRRQGGNHTQYSDTFPTHPNRCPDPRVCSGNHECYYEHVLQYMSSKVIPGPSYLRAILTGELQEDPDNLREIRSFLENYVHVGWLPRSMMDSLGGRHGGGRQSGHRGHHNGRGGGRAGGYPGSYPDMGFGAEGGFSDRFGNPDDSPYSFDMGYGGHGSRANDGRGHGGRHSGFW